MPAKGRIVGLRRNLVALSAATAVNIVMLLGMILVDQASISVETSSPPIEVHLIQATPKLRIKKPETRGSLRSPMATPRAMRPLVAPKSAEAFQARSTEPSAEPIWPPLVGPAMKRSILRSRADCLTASHLTTREWERCADILRVPQDRAGMPQVVGGEKQLVFDQQAERRAAINAYKRSSSTDDYPGLRSTFLGKMPLPNDAQGPPGSFIVRR